MDSLEIVLNQMKDNAKVVDETIKSDYVSLKTEDGIKLSFIHNGNGLVNVSALLSKIMNVNVRIVNKQLSRWLHTRNGVWTIDNMFNDKRYYTFNNS